MSWDVMIFNTTGSVRPHIEQFTESDYQPLGSAVDVRERLSNIVPDIDWTDPAWGIYEGDGFSIEFNVGTEDPIDTMMLHARGSGDAIKAIVNFARPLGWSALDCSTDEFLDLDRPSHDGWEEFKVFRNKVYKQTSHSDESERNRQL